MENNSLDRWKCYICERQLSFLTSLGPKRRKTDKPNLDNVLRIEFSGWYGEYIDGTKEILVCGECAQDLQYTLPWVQRALAEAELSI